MKFYFYLLISASCLAVPFTNYAQQDFFQLDQIQEIKIETEAEKWRYLLDSLRVNGDGSLEATVEINGKTYEKAQFRYQDFKAFTPSKKVNPLHLELGEKHGDHSTVSLSHALRDPSLLREVMAYQIMGSYLPAPRANLAKVYVNEEFYALLVNIEPMDAAYMEKYYGDSDGTLFKSQPQLGVKATSGCKQTAFASLQYDQSLVCYQDQFEGTGNWKALQQMSKNLNGDLKALARTFGIDETLWMLAINNVLVNLNSYTGRGSQNYGLYRNAEGQFYPIFGEMNLAFGSYKNTGEGSDLKVEELYKLDPLLHAYSDQKPLISKLLANDHYRKIYISHMRTILEDYFWNEKFESQVMDLHQKIEPILVENGQATERFKNSLISTTGTRSKIPGLVAFMRNRARFLKKHPTMTVIPSNLPSIELAKREQFSSKKIEAFEFQVEVDRFPKDVVLYYRYEKNGDLKKVNMTDDGKQGDKTANDGIFGTKVIPKGDTIEYYIFVENSGAASFEPSNYPFHLRKASLKELNK
ncbi:MAG: CotH kinase family protein [Bacteroidota bacterium]